MNTFELKDVKTVPDVVQEYTSSLKYGHVPIVIDNGSYNCRVGWATDETPRLIYKNLIARTRKERGKKDGGGELQVGNEIVNIEAVRFQLKQQFDRNVVTHPEVQEQLFDYAFYHLGIDTDGKVDHPILLTEPFLNLTSSRQLVSELLFECYNIPSLCLAVDGLMTYSTCCNMRSGLLVNLGHHATHLIPILEGRSDPWHSRRLNLGGSHITWYLHRLLQLKYPTHCNAITLSRTEELVHDHTFIAEDYQEELKLWSDATHYDNNTHVVQLPYTAPPVQSLLTLEQQKEKKRELARRLVEMNNRKREEKLAEEEELLQNLLSARDLLEEGDLEALEQLLAELGLSSSELLLKEIATVETRVERIRQRIVSSGTEQLEERVVQPAAALGVKDKEDLESWLAETHSQRQALLQKRTARRQRRRELAQRRTAAAQERMRLISQLARKEKKEDTFGSRDEDWDVYKAINKDDSDSEEETERLNELEEALKQHDPNWTPSGTEQMAPGESHQLHVGVERLRAPETLFQPALVGSQEAGLAESIECILKTLSADQQDLLCSNVFLTGGAAQLPGLAPRLARELRSMRPQGASFTVNLAPLGPLAAWTAGRHLAASPHFHEALFTRQEWEERGPEWFKQHGAGNWCFPSPT